MRLPLTHKQKEWVEKTLAGMSLDEKLGQLLCPWIGGLSDEKLKRLFDEVPLGSVFFADWNLTQIRRSARLIGKLGRIPALIAADMDNGTKSGTLFPSALACAAANKPRLMRERGRITGREIRSMGIHWSFAPVADLLLNPQNPELNTRSWGNRAEAVLNSIVEYAKGKGLNLDKTQIQPVGVGIREPFVAKPSNADEARKNMRVEFRVVRVPAEATKPADFDF